MTPPKKGTFTGKKNLNITDVHSSLNAEVIEITVDRLKLILNKHAASIEQKKSWIAPLGIGLTILLALTAGDFKSDILPADTWLALFIFGGALTVAWLVYTGVRAFRSKSIEDLIEEIKKSD